MTTYNSYAAAKIANPKCDIARNGKIFAPTTILSVGDAFKWTLCNPANHCPTLAEFSGAGYKLVEGDLYEYKGAVITVNNVKLENTNAESDCDRYVLRAKALGQPQEEKGAFDVMAKDNEAAEAKAVAEYKKPQPQPRTKVEYVKVKFVSDKEKAEAFINGGLRYFTHGSIRGDLEHDTIPVTRLDELLCGNAIYRRIETEISERDLFIDSVKSMGLCFFDGSKLLECQAEHLGSELFNSGKFKLVD